MIRLLRQFRRLWRALVEIDSTLTDLNGAVYSQLDRIAVALETIAWYHAGMPTGIRGIRIDQSGDGSMAVSNVTVELLPAKATAVSQAVTVAVAGYQTMVLIVAAPNVEVKFAVPPGSAIDLTVASRDEIGNTSKPFVVPTFLAVDNVAPDSPDGIAAFRVNDTAVAEPGFEELVPV